MTVLSQPKPTKADRPERVITTAGFLHAKGEPLDDPSYRKWIRTHTCLLTGWDGPCATHPDRQPIEAAHLGSGGMADKTSDVCCVPLCPYHHDRLDQHRLSERNAALVILWRNAVSLRETYLNLPLPVGHETREELLAGMKLLLPEIAITRYTDPAGSLEAVVAWLESTLSNNEDES